MSIVVEIQSIGRPRQYVSAARLYAMFPLVRFSYERGAYVLRFVGETRGPVLRKDRRRRAQEFAGSDRRAGAVDLLQSSRPLGSVRRIEATEASRRGAESAKGAKGAARAPDATRHRPEGAAANRRRRQHGRQRPPRPHH
ncbi:MAG TPA: hypothetical protein VHV28_01590 [Solirubrobacteraceae bacterium]|jgi:hypothetical protein|nr:hypothetical protein [Solirubrobacteraceae bacterium]